MEPRQLDEATLGAMRSGAPALHNGTYTIAHPKHGHFTVKVHTAREGALAGRRIVSLLVGPDNTSDYRGVAFWNDDARHPDGSRWPHAAIWSRFRGPDSKLPLDGYHYQYKGGWSLYEQKVAIFVDLALRKLALEDAGERAHSHFAGEGYTILRESRCVSCNRKLTHPESIRLGIGPECAGRSST